MIMNKGNWIWDQSQELERRAYKRRIKQLEDYIKKNNLEIPKSDNKLDEYYLGYNMDSEE